MSNPELAVRNYLLYIKNPTALIDKEAVQAKRVQLKQEFDPIKRLRLQTELSTLEKPTHDGIEQAFISVAKNWGAENGISAEAFMAEGVPASVLKQAGFKGMNKDITVKPVTRRRRRSRVTSDTVREHFSSKPFSIQSVTEETGASAGMVRKVILEAVEEGVITVAGKDPDHNGPGRARLLYRLA